MRNKWFIAFLSFCIVLISVIVIVGLEQNRPINVTINGETKKIICGADTNIRTDYGYLFENQYFSSIFESAMEKRRSNNYILENGIVNDYVVALKIADIAITRVNSKQISLKDSCVIKHDAKNLVWVVEYRTLDSSAFSNNLAIVIIDQIDGAVIDAHMPQPI